MNNYLDFSTAEKALHSIAEAYRHKDINAALACKDFEAEAKLMLQRFGKEFDRETLTKTANALHQSFCAHTLARWPNFNNVSSNVGHIAEHSEGVYVVTEVGTMNGQPFKQDIFMSKSEVGWRVLNPVPRRIMPTKKPWWRFW